jgi:cytoskeletal protein RodZ
LFEGSDKEVAMALRRSPGSGKPQFRLSQRNVLIAAGFIVGLLVLVAVLYFFVIQPSGQTDQTAGKSQGTAAAANTSSAATKDALAKAEWSPTPEKAVSEPPQATVVAQATEALPTATRGIAVQPQPTAASTLIPAPAGTAVVTGMSPTALGAGGGELPASSSGLPWLLPVAVLLLATTVWWRWRRAHATS